MVHGELTTTAKHRQTEAPKLIHLLRGDLDWIVMKAMEKDRTRRYETANGLATDVKRFLQNEPISARPPSTIYRTRKLIRRNKMPFAAASAVTLALVLGILASLWQAVRATRFRDEARGQAWRAENEAVANRQNLYAADMNLAAQALENFNLPGARELLEKHRPPRGNASNSPLRADLRGWEWRYLVGQCRSDEIATLGSFGTRVFTVSISPDARWLAAACGDGKVPVWDLHTRRLVTTFELFRAAASFQIEDRNIAAVFSPDSRVLAAAGATPEIALWDVATHTKLATLSGHTGTVEPSGVFAGRPIAGQRLARRDGPVVGLAQPAATGAGENRAGLSRRDVCGLFARWQNAHHKRQPQAGEDLGC